MKSVFHLLPLVAALWLASCRTTSVSVPATVSAPTWTFTHGPPPALLLPTLSPTRREPPTWTPTLRPTVTPVPSASPTLGPLVTRTLAPPAECPAPGNPPPMKLSIYPEEVVLQIERYLDTGGSAQNLRATLTQSLAKLDPEAQFLSLSVTETDVTGDGIADAVVSLILDLPSGDGFGSVSVFGCQSGQVDVLMTESATSQFPFMHIATHDLNADGVPEIVYSVEDFGAHDSTTSVFIREWDGHEFRQLLVPPGDGWPYFRGGAAMFNLIRIGSTHIYDLIWEPDTVEIDSLLPDTDGNGTRELILSGGVGRDYTGDGPQRLVIDTWSWNGEAFTLWASRFEAPEFRFQAVRDGDAAFARGALDEALGFYLQSLNDPKLKGWSIEHLRQLGHVGPTAPTPPPDDPDERPRLAGYAEYRMMLVHTVQGQEAEARSLLDAMVGEHLQGSPGYPYLEMATAFYEALEGTGSVESACTAARELAQANADTILTPLGSQFYGYLYEDYTPESICPVG